MITKFSLDSSNGIEILAKLSFFVYHLILDSRFNNWGISNDIKYFKTLLYVEYR